MKKVLKWILIVLAVAIVLVLTFMGYMGLLGEPKVSEMKMGPYLFVYEPYVGPYMNTGKVFDRVYKAIGSDGIETKRELGIYFDDPSNVPAEKLRSQCGVVIEENDFAKFASVSKKYRSKIIETADCVVAEFPIRNSLSYAFGPMKAYPALAKYAQAKGYRSAVPYELYDMPAGRIYFVMPVIK